MSAELEPAIRPAPDPDYEPERGDPEQLVGDLVLGAQGDNAEQRRLLLLLQEEFDVTVRRSCESSALYHVFVPHEGDDPRVYVAEGSGHVCRKCGAVIDADGERDGDE